jgi:hypothetical protein
MIELMGNVAHFQVLLAMVVFPEVQCWAHAELDAAVHDRLPTFADAPRHQGSALLAARHRAWSAPQGSRIKE